MCGVHLYCTVAPLVAITGITKHTVLLHESESCKRCKVARKKILSVQWLVRMYVHRQIRHFLSPSSRHHHPVIITIIIGSIIFLFITSLRHVKLRHSNIQVCTSSIKYKLFGNKRNVRMISKKMCLSETS